MNATDAVRFLAHEAKECRGRGVGDGICVILPVVAQALAVQPMNDAEAKAFLRELTAALKTDLRSAA